MLKSKTFSVQATKGDDMWTLLKQAAACGITAAAMLRWTLRAMTELATHKGDELSNTDFLAMARIISNTSLVRLDYVPSSEDILNALDAKDEVLRGKFLGTSMSTVLRVALIARARALKAGEEQ